MLKLICPEVKEQPEIKPCPICGGKDLKVHQTIPSRIKDSVIQKVVIRRMKCEGCHYTFRSYPEGVRAYSGRSKRLVFLGVILYLAGLSYEKCEWFLGGVIRKKAGWYGHYLEGYSSFREEVERQVYEPPQGDKPGNRTGWHLL